MMILYLKKKKKKFNTYKVFLIFFSVESQRLLSIPLFKKK